MIKHLVFAVRYPYLPAWGLVNLHTSIGLIRAEYVPNTEIHLLTGAYAYDFNILEDDIPAPGYFTCANLIDPYITPYADNAQCPSCFSGLSVVDFAGVEFMAALVPNSCGGRACLVMVPASQVCNCGGGGGPEDPDLDGVAFLANDQEFTGNNTYSGNVTVVGQSSFTGTTVFNGRVSGNVVALVSGATVDMDLAAGNHFTLLLGANATLANPTNVAPGTYIVRVAQDGAGSRTLAFGNNFRFTDGIPPVLSTPANSIDILTFVNFGGSDLYLVDQKNFQP